MSTMAVNGDRVVSGSVTIPMYGAWSADVTLADAVAIAFGPKAVTLTIGDLSLVGTVIRQGSIGGSQSARIVGGAAGWRKTIPAKGYSHVFGVRISTIVGDAANEVGESVTVDADRTIGTLYARETAPAERVMHLLAGQWWIAPDGSTQTKARDTTQVVAPFTIANRVGARGQFEIATEAISQWQPGRTFVAPTISGVQTVSSITIEATNEGELRLHVLNTDGGAERLRVDLQSMVRAEIATLDYAGVWEYTISASLGEPGISTTIDCTPTDSRMPALTNVPLFGIGVVSPSLVGANCRIRFVNCDPTRPECIGIDSQTEHVTTIEAVALLFYNVFQQLTTASSGPWSGTGLQPNIVTSIAAALVAQAVPAPPGMIAQTALAASLAASMTTPPIVPSNALEPTMAAACLAVATKIPDVSSLCPSIGVPNG